MGSFLLHTVQVGILSQAKFYEVVTLIPPANSPLFLCTSQESYLLARARSTSAKCVYLTSDSTCAFYRARLAFMNMAQYFSFLKAKVGGEVRMISTPGFSFLKSPFVLL